jgi:hypothetical protein
MPVLAAGRIHRREIGIGDDHIMPALLEHPCYPLALGASFEHKAPARLVREQRAQAVSRREDPTLDDDAPLHIKGAYLGRTLVHIQPDE